MIAPVPLLAQVEWVEFGVFAAMFVFIAVLGFGASRWKAAQLEDLEEWGVAGRRFGTVITWFLIGGDLYTAYTFIAVPAFLFGKGALGLFALPYTVVVYPLMFLILPKLWQVASDHGYVTPSDYARERFDSHTVATLVAVTGIVATIPYIALQAYGIEIVIAFMGVSPQGALIAAFVILAVFTYASGLRAPALIALVKDTAIYLTVIVAVIWIPMKLGGYRAVFSAVPASKLALPADQHLGYVTLFLGSALALFLYPHALTGIFSSRSKRVVERNMALLPAYTFLLGLVALLGYMAISAAVRTGPPFGANGAVPQLFEQMFPDWFRGFAYAAIGIGALVPASVMAIAAANLAGRNLVRQYVSPDMSDAREASVTKILALVVLAGALAFILLAPAEFVINFQLAGGVWILQTLPAIFLAVFVRWLDRRAVIAGWVVGIGWGTWMLAQLGFNNVLAPLPWLGIRSGVYVAVTAFVANLLVVLAGSGIAAMVGEVQGRARPPRDEDLAPLVQPLGGTVGETGPSPEEEQRQTLPATSEETTASPEPAPTRPEAPASDSPRSRRVFRRIASGGQPR